MSDISQPLADQIRPGTLSDFVGQTHLVGPNKPIHLAVKKKQIHSLILWGPPGCGKTTLARIIAAETKTHFYYLSAVSAGKNDIRKIINNNRQILFLDEIHRFNKAQQDYLLPYVENGTLILIGATTENPSFEIISPLLSRCQIFTLNELSPAELSRIISQGYQKLNSKLSKLSKSSNNFLTSFANGDARQALNLLETTYRLYDDITPENLKQALQNTYFRYDKKGEEHYNTISAFIKSMRASNPDAALYYLSRMIEAGEDPLFIARRMVVFASEDIGIAQPTALVVANEIFRACEIIGYPECAINLSHGTVYLSQAKKNRASYNALRAAQKDVRKYGNLPIPLNLRNAPTKLMKSLGYGSIQQDTNLLPKQLKNKKYLQTKP